MPVGGVLSKIRIELIACGGHHSLATTPNGLLFAWGKNSFGQLGIGSCKSSEVPKWVFQLH